MTGPIITKDKVETILDKKFIRVFDLQYEEGKHYFDATRRPLDNIVATKTEEEFKTMLPDAVSCVVIVELPGKEPQLLLSYEYRYPTGRFLLSVPAGLMDPEDRDEENPIATTAIREIHEETGIVVDTKRDSVSVINPLLFSTPGMTDESNALALVILHLDNLDEMNQKGGVGSECFDGFSLIDKEKARELLKKGVDDKGHFYSVYTWSALMYFVSDMWK
ncbi:NUDIX domain-containing protein [Butyrivibrio proteoclasticus B316]|uniref:NUDIX domain-containing protein n=1 Tax=Butyrivibrio proteoclasticus (strain ATCC 51982 / DSM 14932 / B316) TaxID=515622 RepID=E0RXD2_BUTPB|nr:NUDIX hydrolase [Butyrivibrio proteoclasticus]ADL32970.1 NUDIX domain-containing protein [Butyrivibrio proteoclasticus B316]